jgi:IPT/TIG domain-containing protein/Calx-beta domain-containing protein
MLRHFCHALMVSAILLSGADLAAQSCPNGSWPSLKFSGTNCATGISNSPCKVSDPVTFSLVDGTTGQPYVLQSCETGVTWSIAGVTSQTTATSISYTFPSAGSFFVSANVTPDYRNANLYMLVGNGGISASFVKTTYAENEGPAVVNVHTNYSPTTVDYATVNYYNDAAGRFTPVSGTVSFAAGEHDKSVSIPLINDSVFEGVGHIAFQMTNATNGALFIDSNGSYSPNAFPMLMTVTDDDPPPTINVAASKYTFSEKDGNAVVTLNRTGDMLRTVSVNYYVYGGSGSGSVTFGPNETSRTITLPIPNDNVWTPDRTWTLTIDNATNGAVLGTSPYSYYLQVPVVITDDEPVPTISINDDSVIEGTSGRTNAHLTLTVSTPLTFPFAIALSYGGTAARTVDYDSPTTSLFFNTGDTVRTVTIPVIGDTQVEPNESVVVTLGATTSFGPSVTNAPAIVKGNGTLTILNDDYGMGWLKLALGTTGRMSIYLGNPTTATDTVALGSSKPDVAKVPSSFAAQSGRSTLDFDVQALSVGTSLITAKLPASLGGTTLTANVDVYTPATLTATPSSLSVPVNTTGALNVTMSPAPAAPVDVKVSTPNGSTIQVPATVNIGTSGTGTFNVKGLAAGNGVLILTLPNENGGFDTTVNVTVTGAPTGVYVSQIAPPNGPTAGGTATTISGLNFASPCSVTFGGTAASSVAFVSPTTLNATTPAHAGGTVDVGVTCGADHFTLANGFTYTANAPHLASVSPISGTTHGGTVVVLSGSDLRSACGVTFGGIAAKILSDLTPGKLVVTTPAHDTGAVDVTLQCGDSTATIGSAFAFVAGDEQSAVITDVDPLAAAPGQSVTINGIRFRPSDAVTFGPAHAAVTSTMPTSHVAIVPAVAAGKVAVTLTDPDGHVSTTGPIFTILEPVTPRITSVSPSRVAPGGEIVITGEGFRAPYIFALDDKSAGTIVDLSFSRAVVRIDPSRAAGSYTLGVLNAAGNLAAVGPKIDVGSALEASSIGPICATSNGGADVTIHGSGFQSGVRVSFGTAAATNVRVLDDHTMMVTVPEGRIGWPVVTITNPNGDTTTVTRGFFYYSPYDKDGGCAATRTRGVRH